MPLEEGSLQVIRGVLEHEFDHVYLFLLFELFFIPEVVEEAALVSKLFPFKRERKV